MQTAWPIGMLGTHSGSVGPATGQIILGSRTTYGNSGNTTNTFISSIGGNPTYSVLMEFLNTSATWGTWNTSGVWSAVGGFAPGFTGWPGPKMIKVPMQVTNTPLTWTDVTGGGQDSNFTSFFNYCYTNGVQNICPGWEFNGNWYPWGVFGNDTTGNQTGFVSTWQHIWNLANTAHSGYFKFWWNPDFLGGTSFTNASVGGPYYPGDAYVDVIGMDIYNTYTQGSSFPGDATMLSLITTGPGANWNGCQTYAIAHNKALCVPEQGMSSGSPDGGDDPTFVNNLWNLYVTAASVHNLTVYAMPWDNVGSSPISGYPNSLAALTTNVGIAVADGLVKGNPSSGQVTRSTASQFPLSNAAYPGATTTISGIALGPAGDLILVPILVTGGGTAATVTASSPANSIEFRRVNVPYVDASWPGGTAETELWVGVVTAAAAYATGVTITATFTGTDTYTLMTVDELTSNVGANTNWLDTTFTGNTNASSTSLDYLSVAAPTSSAPLAYYGYLQLSGTGATGGTNPINAQTFTYTGTTTSTGQIAFCGNIQSAQSYAPVGTASVATPTFGFGQIWTANAGTAPQLALSQPVAQTGTDGTPISGFSVTAAGGSGSYTFSIANQPTGITINTATGAVSGTPSAAQTLTTSITVTDGSGQSVTVYFPFVTTSSSSNAPKYPPPGVTLASTPSFNSDFSTMANTSASAGPYFAPLANGAATSNNATAELANTNIVSGQLVLTLSSGGNNAYGAGAFVTTSPAALGTGWPTPSNGGFDFATGYIEFSITVPSGNWWACWVTNSTNNSPYVEYDIAENGNSGADLTTTFHGPTLGTYAQAGGYPNQPAVGSTAYIGSLLQSGSFTTYSNGVQQSHLVNGDGTGITINSEPACIILNIGSYEGPIPAYLKVNYVRVWALA